MACSKFSNKVTANNIDDNNTEGKECNNRDCTWLENMIYKTYWPKTCLMMMIINLIISEWTKRPKHTSWSWTHLRPSSNNPDEHSHIICIAYKPVIRNESFVKSTMFSHHNIHKYTWTSTDGKIQPDSSCTDIHSHTDDVQFF